MNPLKTNTRWKRDETEKPERFSNNRFLSRNSERGRPSGRFTGR